MTEKKIERKSLIDLGYSKYWYIVYTDGSFEIIPIIEKLINLGKLKALKTDKVCQPDYAVPEHVTQNLFRKIRIIKHK